MEGPLKVLTQYELSPISAEFLDPGTEMAFREYIRPTWVRDTRRAMVMAAMFYLAFGVSDYFLLGMNDAFQTVCLSRMMIFVVGLAVAFGADRFWRGLVDGLIPTLVVGLAMMAFLSFTLLFPFDVGWHAMGMMLMLLGTYVFIPNRFLPAMGVAVWSTIAFIWLMLDNFDLGAGKAMILILVLFGMNLFCGVSAARVSRLTRETFRDAQILRQANQRLTEEAVVRKRLEQDLIAQVHHDELTGVSNRRRFQELARQCMRQAEASETGLSLMLLDVDYFKQINDTYGHSRADEVLKALARICQARMGEEDMLARVGGEEFALMLPGVDLEGARKQAERIRVGVWESPVLLADAAIHITISIGVVEWQRGESLTELMRRADQTLQAAKYNGRNRVEIAAKGNA
jgi:diguanylate cyclase (GGDEF)-like protein